MKIPFDIKFRPQIESGEYKVVTGDDRPVRIISWDKKVYGGRFEIVALVPTSQGDTESVQLYCPDGTLIASNWSEKFKLFIVTPEPELTEFEEGLVNFYNERSRLLPDKDGVYNKHDCAELLHKSAKILLELAKKELCTGCAAEGYIKGRQDALKEMEENRVYKHEGPVMPTYYPCPHGGNCTNPFRDCINCPMQSTGISTATGTSTAKVEG